MIRNRGRRLLPTLLACLPAGLTLAACSPAQELGEPVALNISAAASLTDALQEMNNLYTKFKPWVAITPNFASSGTLQQQIENGAPCDVFISAATAQMDNLQQKGLLLPGSRRDLLTNSVVLIVPASSNLGLGTFDDLTSDKVKKIAIGDPKSVPAGTYAQQTLDFYNVSQAVASKLVLGSTVRQVLTYVETGNVDAGVVFATDVLTSNGVKVVASAPDVINSQIVYPAAVLKGSKAVSAAQEYLYFLLGPEAEAIFSKYGFTMAETQSPSVTYG